MKHFYILIIATCHFVQAQVQLSAIDYLDTNNVRAAILCNADFGWDLSNSQYEVPKGSGKHALFCGSLWIGGFRNGSLKMAANTYRQNGQDFWPGPLDTTNGTITLATSNQWNQLWKVSKGQIDQFIQQWTLGNVQSGTYVPPSVILNWPAHGTGNQARYLAPFVDVNNDGVYDPVQGGDYPKIKGDQMIWWVINDALPQHTETGAGQIGVEIQCSAFSFHKPCAGAAEDFLNYTTFYNYKIINRNASLLDSAVVGFFIDADLGNPFDDYVGCDVTRNMAFTYNASNTDNVYGPSPPALSIAPMIGPVADLNDAVCNDRDSCIDCSWNMIDTVNCIKMIGSSIPVQDDSIPEKIAMSSFMYADNTTPWSLNSSQSYYNMLQARWNNGTHLTYGGNGTSLSSPPCGHAFFGSSDPNGWSFGYQPGMAPIVPPVSTPWTEHDLVRTPGERKMFTGMGKFTLKPAVTYEVEMALVFSRDLSCSNNLCAVSQAKQDADELGKMYNCAFPSCGTWVGMNDLSDDQAIVIFPNPASNVISISTPARATITILNTLGEIVLVAEIDAEETLNVKSLARGLYTVLIQTQGSTLIKKLVLQ